MLLRAFFVVRLAHSHPDGAPLVAITGQVGTDRMQLHDLYADPTHIAAAGQLISETKNPVILDFCQN